MPEPGDMPTRDTAPIRTPGETTGFIVTGTVALQPGFVLAERYRVVAPLGKGGMGEVYRADDLTLGVSVALKFLPASLAGDSARLERLRGEVRLARQISHPNLCRVYDINQATGPNGLPMHFLSMEYVDGEDLSSLLRRVGRLTSERAVRAARQICFALAAAHEQGVIHRDLKPSNIMIDGRGNAKIMDFGVAGFESELLANRDVAAGTPAYMAPEQLAGREVSPRSDIYSLGLVLHELFTGEPAFDTARYSTFEELRLMHSSGLTPTRPSSVVADLDEAVERTILRCLEADPAMRPGSAMAVAAALPGGDPLAAAIAAGETPSPALVAASGARGSLRPLTAVVLLAAVLVMLGVSLAVRERASLLWYCAPRKSAERLTEAARDACEALGYPPAGPGVAADTARGFGRTELIGLTEGPEAAEIPRDLRSRMLTLWYRQSPSAIIPAAWYQRGIGPEQPPLTDPGEVLLSVDLQGRLVSFRALPTRRHPGPGEAIDPGPAPDWGTPLRLAGLEESGLRAVAPGATPPGIGTQRSAWEGTLAEADGLPVRIEAAAERGKLTWFAMTMREERPAAAGGAQGGVRTIVWTFVLAAAVGGIILPLAIRHVRAGKGDVRGARRLAIFAIIVHWISHVLWIDDASWFLDREPWSQPLAHSIYMAMLWWLIYTAVEPVVRRVWPTMLVGWSRLLEGRGRDPMVGRDLLIGALVGVGASMLPVLVRELRGVMTGAPQRPMYDGLLSLLGVRYSLALTVGSLAESLGAALIPPLLLVILRLILRRTMLSVIAHAVLFAVIYADSYGGWIGVVMGPPQAALSTFILVRFGVLATAVHTFVTLILITAPPTVDAGSWYAASAVLPVLVTAGLAVYGFRTALAGEKLFRGSLLDT